MAPFPSTSSPSSLASPPPSPRALASLRLLGEPAAPAAPTTLGAAADALPFLLPPPPPEIPAGFVPQVVHPPPGPSQSDLDLEDPPQPPVRADASGEDEVDLGAPPDLLLAGAAASSASARFRAAGGWGSWRSSVLAAPRPTPRGEGLVEADPGRRDSPLPQPQRRSGSPSRPDLCSGHRPPPPAWLTGRCFRCFSKRHRAGDCRDPFKCANCFRSGHRARFCSHEQQPTPGPGVIDPAPRSSAKRQGRVHPAAAPRQAHGASAAPAARQDGAAAASSAVPPDAAMSALAEQVLVEQVMLLRTELLGLVSLQLEKLVRPVREASDSLQGLLGRIGSMLERAAEALEGLSLAPACVQALPVQMALAAASSPSPLADGCFAARPNQLDLAVDTGVPSAVEEMLDFGASCSKNPMKEMIVVDASLKDVASTPEGVGTSEELGHVGSGRLNGGSGPVLDLVQDDTLFADDQACDEAPGGQDTFLASVFTSPCPPLLQVATPLHSSDTRAAPPDCTISSHSAKDEVARSSRRLAAKSSSGLTALEKAKMVMLKKSGAILKEEPTSISGLSKYRQIYKHSEILR